MERLYYEDVEVGDEWTSGGRTITEADIVNFAGLSGDFNPLHMDEEFAKKTIFGKRIAHGLLGLAVMSGLGSFYPPMRTIAFLGIKEWNFKAPIFIGDTIYVKTKVLEKRLTSKGDRGIIVWEKKVINQKGEVVQEGKTTTMVEVRSKPA
jgi:acyl dehydratase